MTSSPDARVAIPLAERRYDWLFILGFSFFAFSSGASDALHALGLFDGDSFFAQANRDYAAAAGDDFLLAEHPFTRITTAINGFVYGPFYLLMVYSFVKGKEWIRVPALIYVGAMLHGMVEYTTWEYGIGPAPRNPLVFWAFNGPYALIPFLLGVRMWRDQPFTREAERNKAP